MDIQKWLNAWKKNLKFVEKPGEEFLKIPGYFGDPNAGMFVAFAEKATKLGMLTFNLPPVNYVPTLVGKKLVNLTPHAVVYRNGEGKDFTFPSGGSARVDVIPGKSFTHSIEGVGDVVVNTPAPAGEVIGLPEPDGETIYIVSSIVLTHRSVAGRDDVVAPATGPNDGAIRVDGQVKAVTKFVMA